MHELFKISSRDSNISERRMFKIKSWAISRDLSLFNLGSGWLKLKLLHSLILIIWNQNFFLSTYQENVDSKSLTQNFESKNHWFQDLKFKSINCLSKNFWFQILIFLHNVFQYSSFHWSPLYHRQMSQVRAKANPSEPDGPVQ